MGIMSTVLGLVGFGWGIGIGLVVGYFLFIYTQPVDVKDPVIRPLSELDSKTLRGLLPEIPHWVKNPDYDRVDWLNKFVRDLWPFLDKAICKIIREQAKPYIDLYGPKFKLESIEFEQLTLGTLPPTFVGMKVYDTQEKEMIMEPSFKFAGNPNIVVAVKAFGMKATVQLVDVQVFATARVTLRPLIETFPCFSKIVVSLMEKPHVDFGLKLLGGDIMAIPGVYRLVQDLIKEQVANMYLWPKTLEINVVDDANAAKRPVGLLNVKVVRAKGLKKKDLIGKSDPYVKLHLGEAHHFAKVTRTVKGNLNPEWNESFKLIVHDPSTQNLELHVYDWEKIGSHETLGMAVVSLKKLNPEENSTEILTLVKNMDSNDPSNNKDRGTLTVELNYKPFKEEEMNDIEEEDEDGAVEKAPEGTPAGGGLLVVVIHEAEDVEGKHHTNPYARVILRGEEKRTKHIKKNRDPKWDQRFEWILDEPPVSDRLHVEVMSKNLGFNYHLKEPLGYVDINLSDVVNNKRINEKYQLIDSKNGKIQVELQWRPS
ncbi:hypothetical protein MPTK1_1g09920 [Marchantia polymorpha subsp. ruderalis]|uniref:Uncharacterized protein n=2 Tax=Marchantia polymorpha TaxID=3197 RepID=A0AAF6ANG3_MARPO|nr:hypothetical protein MARPO_0096s0009 [Marchantia polymorpha]PTQ32648.1 hypothetical protein MARPO_0096s0009 [Marchantia polymorpha]BBM97982.1 hypothetical protein Mp_1g09920 [Marchantia polymorpha subsp. ruderalis]BBM97983.1 hypothetical protein Mp_1g09920 [Marchantia polymorpha subsp. ruderalis]|eukprot:PTQ32647.1 hypothetical protein MARPO_0096s0009 [Marchantia polymorpha]